MYSGRNLPSADCDDAREALERLFSESAPGAAPLNEFFGESEVGLFGESKDSSVEPEDSHSTEEHSSVSTNAALNPELLLEHLQQCHECRETAESVGELDKTLRDGFQRVGQSIPLPSDDTIARMLRRTETSPIAKSIQRARRTISPTLWLVFFLFALLAGCTVIAAAYKALVANL